MTFASPHRWGRSSWIGPAIGVLLVLVVQGCATTAPSGPTGSPSASSGLPSPSEDLPSPSATPSATTRQLTGKVAAGVESGCLLLSDGGQNWLLLGDTLGVKVGQDITVEGHPDPSAMTTCQQGQPFVVTRVL